MALPPWPQLQAPSDRLNALLGGEVTLMTQRPGALWQVGFAAPFEMFLREEGTLRRSFWAARRAPVGLWAHCRSPALQAALSNERDLLIRVPPSWEGAQDGSLPVEPVDIWDRRKEALLGHAQAREVLMRAGLPVPKVAILGEMRTLHELTARAHQVGTPGATVELRREEGGVVVERVFMKLGASRVPGPA